MQKVRLSTQWLSGWKPSKPNTEVADKGCPGLFIRGGPNGVWTWYRWQSVRNEAVAGKARRKRVRLGRWPSVPLAEAQRLVLEARQKVTAGGVDVTVGDLANAYHRDVLGARDSSSSAWSWGIIRTHILPARPDPRAPPFGDWSARAVRGPDVAAVARAARVERVIEITDAKGRKGKRRLGGKAAARAALRELKAIFSTAVGAGTLEMSPAATIQARALGFKKTSRARRLAAAELRALFDAIGINALLDGTAKAQRLTETTRLGIAILVYVPARTHSLIAARWEEMDLEAGVWTIPPEKIKLHAEERAEARPFAIPLPSTARAILQKLHDLAGDSPWVLAAAKGSKRHLNRKAMIRALDRLQESGRLALGAPATVHDLRRTWRSLAGDLGISFEVGERSLAHVLPGVAETYQRADMLDLREHAAERVAAELDRIRLGREAKVVSLHGQ